MPCSTWIGPSSKVLARILTPKMREEPGVGGGWHKRHVYLTDPRKSDTGRGPRPITYSATIRHSGTPRFFQEETEKKRSRTRDSRRRDGPALFSPIAVARLRYVDNPSATCQGAVVSNFSSPPSLFYAPWFVNQTPTCQRQQHANHILVSRARHGGPWCA